MRSFGNRLGRELLLVAFAGAGTLLTGISGCRSSRQPTVVAVDNNGSDPADANMAPVSMVNDGSQQSVYATYAPPPGSRRLLDSPNGRVLEARMNGVNQAQVQEYAQNAAPIERRAPQGVPAPDQGYPGSEQTGVQGNPQDGGYEAQAAPGQDQSAWSDGEQDAYNQVTEEADTAPPPLPVYDQPPAPAPNYLWTPGYWNYAPAGYYWVPGAWVAAPYYGALWTPGYWGAWHHHYGYHPGYWGRYVGFYGGISYGFGYFGTGYHGGYWRGNDFYYNEAVNRVNTVNIRNVYNRNVVVNNTVINNTGGNNRAGALNRVSYNGGTGGIQARPSRNEVAAFRSPRIAPMTAQLQNQRVAAENRQQFFKQNGGRPPIAAAPRPFAADRVTAPAAQRQEPGGVRPGQMLTPQQANARSGQVEPRSGQPGTQGQAAEQQHGLYGSQAQRALEMQQRSQQTGALQQQRLQGIQAQQQQRSLQEQQRGRNQLQVNQPGVDQSRVQQVQQQKQVQGNPAAAQQQRVAEQQQQRMQFEQQRSQQAQQLQQQRATQQVQQQRPVQGNPAAVQQQRFADQQQQQLQLEQQKSQQAQQLQQQRAAQQAQQQRSVQENPAAQQQQRMQYEQQRSQQVQQQRAAQQAQQQRPVQAESQRYQPQQQRAVPQQQPRVEAAPRQENRAAPQPQSQRRDEGRQH